MPQEPQSLDGWMPVHSVPDFEGDTQSQTQSPDAAIVAGRKLLDALVAVYDDRVIDWDFWFAIAAATSDDSDGYWARQVDAHLSTKPLYTALGELAVAVGWRAKE